MICNGVFGINMPKGCTAVAYADDFALLVQAIIKDAKEAITDKD